MNTRLNFNSKPPAPIADEAHWDSEVWPVLYYLK